MLCLCCAFRPWHMHTEMTGNALKVSFFLSQQLCVFVFVDLIVYRCCQGDPRWLRRRPLVRWLSWRNAGTVLKWRGWLHPLCLRVHWHLKCCIVRVSSAAPYAAWSVREWIVENCNCNYVAHHWVCAFLRNSWWVMQCCSSTRLQPIDPPVWVSGPLRSFLSVTLSELTVIWRRRQQRDNILTAHVFQDVHVSHQTQKWEWSSVRLTSKYELTK